ncbi:hypothetical protein BY458DRAFT_514780 [Sporodiniella umbellata]|nr:hypothetical protein BY458DRAFT_514780 [Sporodiniella umbellata]
MPPKKKEKVTLSRYIESDSEKGYEEEYDSEESRGGETEVDANYEVQEETSEDSTDDSTTESNSSQDNSETLAFSHSQPKEIKTDPGQDSGFEGDAKTVSLLQARWAKKKKTAQKDSKLPLRGCSYKACNQSKRLMTDSICKIHEHQHHDKLYKVYLPDVDNPGEKRVLLIERKQGVLSCMFCSKTYKSICSLRWHYSRPTTNCSTLFFQVKGDPVIKDPSILARATCQSCGKTFIHKKGLRNHILRTSGNCIKDDDLTDRIPSSGDELDSEDENLSDSVKNYREQYRTDLFNEHQVLSKESVSFEKSKVITNHGKRRNHEQALDFAAQLQGLAEEEQKINRWIIENLNLKPFSLFYRDNKQRLTEMNALINPADMDSIDGKSVVCKPVNDFKIELTESNVQDFIDSNRLFNTSRYLNLMRDRNYNEISKSDIALINKDWVAMPHIKFCSAQLFAGALIMDTENHQTIFVNTVEAYGCVKTSDKHSSFFAQNSKSYHSKYDGVWLFKQKTPDDFQLWIGTPSCKCLVTSAVRIDLEGEVKMMGLPFQFKFNSEKIIILIDHESLQKTRHMAADLATVAVNNFNLTIQLRDVWSDFDKPSAYFLCSAPSHFANHRLCRPYTIFTLCDFEEVESRPKITFIASQLFQYISYAVIQHGLQATIPIDLVISLKDQCPIGHEIKSLFFSLLLLFENQNELIIIGNTDLNKNVLEKMAALIIPDLIRVNKKVAKNILRRLKLL